MHYNGEWAGPWEDYLVHGVVPWVDAQLPTIRTAAGPDARRPLGRRLRRRRHRAALAVALRADRVVERLLQGPLRDGPFKHAGKATIAANDPVQLVTKAAPLLRILGTRFFLGSGPNHSHWFKEQETLDYAARLRRLHLPVTLRALPDEEGRVVRTAAGRSRVGLRAPTSAAPPPQSGSSSIPTPSATRLM